MLANWRSVNEGGSSPHDACARLLGEREDLVRTAEEIVGRMEVFAQFESATRTLSTPGEGLVTRGNFLDIVKRVDARIGFLREHRQCRPGEKVNVHRTLVARLPNIRHLNTDPFSQDVSVKATHHLLYIRFRSVAGPLSPLSGELEARS